MKTAPCFFLLFALTLSSLSAAPQLYSMAAALDLYQSGEYEKAISAFSRLIVEEGSLSEEAEAHAHYYLAESYRQTVIHPSHKSHARADAIDKAWNHLLAARAQDRSGVLAARIALSFQALKLPYEQLAETALLRKDTAAAARIRAKIGREFKTSPSGQPYSSAVPPES